MASREFRGPAWTSGLSSSHQHQPRSTLTAIRASTASAAVGQSVTFTATVSDLSAGGATPNGGTVTFSDQNGALGSETLVDGVAEFTTSSLAAGTYTVTASYGGTADFAPSTTGTIVTAAGNGTAGYTGDNGPATAAELNSPWGLAVDSAGDLFIADTDNNVVREVVKATGDIITVAGNGTAGYSGDSGPATAAELNDPNGVAVDSAGDLFIADTDNNVIREVVKATGDIITVAGNGTAGYSGDNGPATAAELNSPRGVAVDSAGDLFIADCGNNVIREVVKATGDIITVAGNGTAGYSGDDGPATAAELNDPNGVAVDSAGDLFIADCGQQRGPRGGQGDRRHHHRRRQRHRRLQRRQRTRHRRRAQRPHGVAVDSAGDLFIADTDNNVIREVVKATGDIITVAGNGTAGYSGDNGPATAAELNGPGRVAVDSAGDLFIADGDNNVVREVTPAVTVTVGPSSALPTLTALDRLDRLGGHRAVGHVHRDGQRPVRGRGNAERGDGHLQRPERNARQRAAGRRRGDVHDLEPGGGHVHRHGLLRRHRELRPEHHGHDRDGGRQRHRRLRGRQRAGDRRRAELAPLAWPSTPRATCSSPTTATTWSARWSRRPATSSPSPATAPPVTAATADPPPPPS